MKFAASTWALQLSTMRPRPCIPDFGAAARTVCSRGSCRPGRDQHALCSWQHALTWDAFSFAEAFLTQPFLVVIGDKVGAFGAYRDPMDIYGRAGAKEKELLVLEGSSHCDLYDKPGPVGRALARAVPFCKKLLRLTPETATAPKSVAAE